MSRKHLVCLFSAFAVLVLLMAACSGPGTGPAPAPAAPAAPAATAASAPAAPVAPTAAPAAAAGGKGPTVGAILFGRDSFFQNIQAGMEAAAKDAGVNLLMNIHNHEIAKETEFIDDYIARKVDAIVITPESVDASVAAIKAAHDAGIKVICFNTCINKDDAAKYISAFYETDQNSLGYQTGEYLAKWIGENMAGKDVNVGILQCDRFEACKSRGDGFRKALADKNIKWKEVANQEGFMPDEGSSKAESILQANPEINILWSENEGGTVGEVIAVRSMNVGDKVKVFGTDISPQLAEMLTAKDNILQAVTGQSPREMGGSAVKAALAAVKGDKQDYYHVVPNAFYARPDTAAIEKYLKEYGAK